MSGDELYHEVVIAGFGGQGVVLAGQILAYAALAEERQVVWAPSYGPEMRGGPVHCTIIVSSHRIGSPEVSLADSVLIMDRASLNRLARRLKPGGLLVVNSTLVPDPPEIDDCAVLSIPANDAAEELGNVRVANVIMLGAFLSERPILSIDSVVGAMRLLAGKGFQHLLEVNERALADGADLAAKLRTATQP